MISLADFFTSDACPGRNAHGLPGHQEVIWNLEGLQIFCGKSQPFGRVWGWRVFAYQYVPHKAVAEVSKRANYRRLVAVNHGSQSEPTAGPTSDWRQCSVVEVAVELVVEM